ncbi:MAG: DUF2996 domain-containing protein [Prochlorococcaceae cyanobacterium]|jgi:hypothetical protein
MRPAPVSDSASPAPEPRDAATPPAAASPAAAAPAATKARPPAPEDQPFERFVPDLLLPALSKEIQAYGGPAPELSFVEGPMPVVGSPCWMVQGSLPGARRFWLCFTAADISSAKTVAVAEAGSEPSLLESFLIDERKITLALLVSRLVQRLNGQKWLGPN